MHTDDSSTDDDSSDEDYFLSDDQGSIIHLVLHVKATGSDKLQKLFVNSEKL